jgi:hypothetical protein
MQCNPKFETTNVPLAGIVAETTESLPMLRLCIVGSLLALLQDMDYLRERYTTICCPLQVILMVLMDLQL